MSHKTKMTSESIPFAHLFFKGRFDVPWHQRYYDWKKDQVVDLLHDFDDAMKNEQDFYFLGTISLIENKGGSWGINDGQQRMTTYTLICARFARYFHDHGHSLEASAMRVIFDIDSHLTKGMQDANELEPRLKPSEGDQTKFNSLIRGEGVGTNGKLTQAWKAIDTFVSTLEPERAEKYCKFLIEKVEVSLLTIPSTVDPNMIFETLNFRGKTLEDFDLMRNHFYSFFNKPSEKSRRDTVQLKLEKTLRHQLVIGNSNKIMEYARSYLQCEYGVIPQKRFYRSVRDNIERSISGKKSSDYIFKLIKRMTDERYMQIFNAIARPDTSLDSIKEFNIAAGREGKKRNLKVLLDELRTYTITQPILLAFLIKYLDLKDNRAPNNFAFKIYSQIKKLNAFVIRTALVERKFEPSRFERHLSDLASQIFAVDSVENLLKIDVLQRLEKSSSSTVLDDKAFIETLKILEVNSQSAKKARLFLLAINADIQSDADTILHNKVTLEHILPQGLEHLGGWDKFTEDEHSRYVNRIGNFALLSENNNKSSKKDNASWKAKQSRLVGSMFALNKQFSDIDDWTPEEIDKRQEKLAKQAAKIWTFDTKH